MGGWGMGVGMRNEDGGWIGGGGKGRGLCCVPACSMGEELSMELRVIEAFIACSCPRLSLRVQALLPSNHPNSNISQHTA